MTDQSSSVSRRGFLQSAAAAFIAPQAPSASAQEPFHSPISTSIRPARISENLFVLADTCNVYLVKDRDRGVLVDFGSGRILDFLNELGVVAIDLILHTHYHRDQAQGVLLVLSLFFFCCCCLFVVCCFF